MARRTARVGGCGLDRRDPIAGTMCICIPLGDRQTILDYIPRQAVKQEDISCDPLSILDLCSRYRPLVLRPYFISFLLSMCPSPLYWAQQHVYLGALMPNVGRLEDASAGCFCPLIARPTGFASLLTIGFGESCLPGQDKRSPHVRLSRVPHSSMGRGSTPAEC